MWNISKTVWNVKSFLWGNAGTEPSAFLKNTGFRAGYRPSAAVFNFLVTKFNRALDELQAAISTLQTETDNALSDLQTETNTAIEEVEENVAPAVHSHGNLTNDGVMKSVFRYADDDVQVGLKLSSTAFSPGIGQPLEDDTPYYYMFLKGGRYNSQNGYEGNLKDVGAIGVSPNHKVKMEIGRSDVTWMDLHANERLSLSCYKTGPTFGPISLSGSNIDIYSNNQVNFNTDNIYVTVGNTKYRLDNYIRAIVNGTIQ